MRARAGGTQHFRHRAPGGVLFIHYRAVGSRSQRARLARQLSQGLGGILEKRYWLLDMSRDLPQPPYFSCVLLQLLPRSLSVLSQDRNDWFLIPGPALATCLWLTGPVTLLRCPGMERLRRLALLLTSAAVALPEPLCLHL